MLFSAVVSVWLEAQRRRLGVPADFWQIFRHAVIFRGLWSIPTAFIFKMFRRFPSEPGGWLSLRSTLSELEVQLDPGLFARIHRSAIVALGQIRELRPAFRGEYQVTLRDGTSLRWSRAYLPALRRFLEPKGG